MLHDAVWTTVYRKVKSVLNEDNLHLLLNERVHFAGTALHDAAERGSTDAVKLLLAYGAAISIDLEGMTPLHYAALHRRLAALKAMPNYMQDKNLLQAPVETYGASECLAGQRTLHLPSILHQDSYGRTLGACAEQSGKDAVVNLLKEMEDNIAVISTSTYVWKPKVDNIISNKALYPTIASRFWKIHHRLPVRRLRSVKECRKIGSKA